MPDPKKPRLHRLCWHKHAKQFYVRIQGRLYYLGADETRAEVERLRILVEWQSAGRLPGGKAAGPEGALVKELVDRYGPECVLQLYRHRDGEPTSEVRNIHDALRPLRERYAYVRCADFAVEQLELIRLGWIGSGRTRTSINKDVNRVKACFRWGVSRKLVPASVAADLWALAPLRPGQAGVAEAPDVGPVPVEHVLATLPHLSPVVQSMVRLQLLTGARPGEVCRLRPRHVDRTGERLAGLVTEMPDFGGTWAIILTPDDRHKGARRGKTRVIPVGPQAQLVLAPFLERDPDWHCFSPRESKAWHQARRAEARITPVYPSELKARAGRKKPPADARFSTMTYGRAIGDAAVKAGVPHWHPHQLRHLAATRLERLYGLRVAQIVCGHTSARTTLGYVAADLERAFRAIEEAG